MDQERQAMAAEADAHAEAEASAREGAAAAAADARISSLEARYSARVRELEAERAKIVDALAEVQVRWGGWEPECVLAQGLVEAHQPCRLGAADGM